MGCLELPRPKVDYQKIAERCMGRKRTEGDIEFEGVRRNVSKSEPAEM